MAARVLPFALLLAGCATGAPAPVVYGRGPVTTAAPAPPPRPARAPVEIRAPRPPPEPARPDWAAGPGAPLSTWALQPDQAAPFDPAALPRTHAVAVGDTLFSLSVRYQIPLRPLIDANTIDAPFTLRVGQTLTLPPPRVHRVRRGETLTAIARRYNIDARSLALLNRLQKPYAVTTGDTLVLPALARGEVDTPAPDVRPAGEVRFAWPLAGRILTRFGPQQGGRRSDGVDIAAADGAEVKAAGDGQVVYTGDDLDGYGQLMLLQHADGWITAYAHCASFAVKEGERVRSGQKIGAAGAGKLHFQVRRGSVATDPLLALPPI